MNNRVFGNYRASNTPLHRLDARVKILILTFWIMAIFLPYGNVSSTSKIPYLMSVVVCSGLLVLALGLTALGKMRIQDILYSIRGILSLLIIISVINIFFYRNQSLGENVKPLFLIGNVGVYLYSIMWTVYLILRILLTLIATLLFTSTTKPMDISYALEWFFKPLEVIKVPVRNISLMMSLALRFIPEILVKSIKIRKAQASRGLDAINGNILVKVKSLFSLTIPLVITSLYEAIYVAQALDARGYNSTGKRTHYKTNKVSIMDWLILFVSLLFVSIFLFLSLYRIHGLRLDLPF